MAELVDHPIIQFFCPQNADGDVRDYVKAIEKAFSSSKEKKEELLGILKQFGVKAIIVAPEYYEARRADTQSEFLLYVLPGQRPLTGDGLFEIKDKAEEILGLGKALAYPFTRESSEELGRCFKIKAGDFNPISKVFQELDSREGGAKRHA